MGGILRHDSATSMNRCLRPCVTWWATESSARDAIQFTAMSEVTRNRYAPYDRAVPGKHTRLRCVRLVELACVPGLGCRSLGRASPRLTAEVSGLRRSAQRRIFSLAGWLILRTIEGSSYPRR